MLNRDDIIRMAREAGIKLPDGAFPERGSFALPELLELARLSYAAGAAAEREACAKVCEMTYEGAFEGAQPCFETPEQCAAAIRARGQA